MSEDYQEDLSEDEEQPEGEGTGEPDPAAEEAERQAAVAAQVVAAVNAAKANAGREVAELRRELENLRAQQQNGKTEAVAQPEADDDLPDQSLYPDEFRAALAKRDERLIARVTKTFQEQLGILAQPVIGSQAQRAVDATEAALKPLRTEWWLELPDFKDRLAQQFRSSGIDPALWTDPKTIRAVAGVVAATYDDYPEPTAPDPAATERARQSAAAGLQRASAGAASATRGGGPATTGAAEPTAAEQAMAEMIGVSVAEFRGLGDVDATGYTRIQRQKQAKERAAAR